MRECSIVLPGLTPPLCVFCPQPFPVRFIPKGTWTIAPTMSIFAMLPEVLFSRCMSWCSDQKANVRQTSCEMCVDVRTVGQRLLEMTRVANQMRTQWIRERDMRRAHSELQFQLFIANQNAVEDRAHVIRTTAARVQAARLAALADALNADSDEPDSEDEDSDEDSVESQEEEMHTLYHF